MARVTLKNPKEIEGLKKAGELVAETFKILSPHMKPGMSLLELDKIAEDYIRSKGAKPAYKGYKAKFSRTAFPATLCISVNEQICHGIPSVRKLREGDIVGVDIGVFLNGWAGDACFTYAVGNVTPRAKELLETAKKAMYAGIEQVRPGARLGDIGAAIQGVAEGQGFSVVRELGGHGLGRKIHEDEPHVNHFGKAGTGMKLQKGMVFTIEPMINEGQAAIRNLPDGWTIVTEDGKLSAQFEHTVAVTSTGYEILTPWE